ncbi:MAG: sialate O-acetylesterase [Verrucomicrobia bacterium]|nr:sialate O-acetylesterase [Verrucomicrobiota bacterium]
MKGICLKSLCASAPLREFFVFLWLSGMGLHADVSMPPIFGDHMVLQQGVTLPVWGSASPGEHVSLSVGNLSEETVADASGKWRITLRPLLSSSAPLVMVINGNNRLELHDVIVGDVWLCAGEANMAFSLSDATVGKESDEKIADEKLRFFQYENTVELKNAHGTQVGTQAVPRKGRWVVCSPESAPAFSAVGYFFARDLRTSHHLPIGMIQCTSEDSPIGSWISQRGLTKPPSISPSPDRETRNSQRGLCFEQLIHPLIPYGIAGIIWYQGESDEGSAALQYRRILPRMIRDWRERWGEGPIPFYFVSQAGFGNEEGSAVESYHAQTGNPALGRALPWLREGTACSLSLPFTGMAQASDLGIADERIPPDKLDVGRRLALLARHRVYGEEIVDSGPLYRGMNVEKGKDGGNDKVRVDFDSVGGGLVLGVSPWKSEGFSPSLVTSLKGFALAGSDRKWFPAQGRIEGDTVLLWSDAVPHPKSVRYGWRGFPKGTLYNKEGLPAAPFRSDTDQPE